ncbi:hypothetical protein K6119_07600 [Paracrocinitomix mangrovi]|uniref:hypothetical protein n=1 Tax=Paracrocinitomix mangrovi TaxID=2862509 RepID=UPI001C8D525D|nr:hypothetical protein [Paracrocinitomix mangrovi]UKN03379.1 hypothetical protein K6119_07600 [Paracrocinitomix mangrovi]
MYSLENFFKDLWNAFKRIEGIIKIGALLGALVFGSWFVTMFYFFFKMDGFDSFFFGLILPAILIFIILIWKNWERIE